MISSSRTPMLAILLLLLATFPLNAQDTSSFSFGTIKIEDFSVANSVITGDAEAVILADEGRLKVISNGNSSFGYEFTRKQRVKILKQTGVAAGVFSIPVYFFRSGDGLQDMTGLKAITYNLDNGKINRTSLAPEDVHTEMFSKRYQVKKFSLPALKEGAIFDIEYTIRSYYFEELRPWNFQGEYPCLWSEFEVEVPAFFDFVVLQQGYLPYHAVREKELTQSYYVPGYKIKSNVLRKKWIIKDVPPLKEESFTTTVENHRSRIEFQLSSIRPPDAKPIPFLDTWPKVYEMFEKRYDFGKQLKEVEGQLIKILQPVMGVEAMFRVDRVKRIYEYVRDNYTCEDRSGLFCSTGLKEILKTKRGNLADINLLLVAMLREQLIPADPVILSTRSNGLTHQVYPLMDGYNYVICHVNIDGRDYFLDASSRNLGFAKLDPGCYNGHARILSKEPRAVFLLADSLQERKVTQANLSLENSQVKGTLQVYPGYFESLHIRDLVSDKDVTGLERSINAQYGADVQVKNVKLESVAKKEEPVKLSYEVSYDAASNEIIYVNPVLVPVFKENPFTSVTRSYPVELPYKSDETYLLNLPVPEGFKVEALPKSTRVNLNDNDGYFEYIIGESNGKISLRTRFVLYKSTFDPEDYQTLRDFFGYVVNKQQEQIVLKKANSKP